MAGYNPKTTESKCIFCEIVAGNNTEKSNQEDIIYRDVNCTAFIAAKWWINNPGHIIIIPNNHFENIYDISDDMIGKIYSLVKKLSIVLKKSYECDGVSTRQHNEPAGNQDIRHFHIHVFPRYQDDKLYELHDQTHWTTLEERRPYINKFKKYLK